MTQRTNGVVIVGGGAAGHACAATLRKQGFTGPIRVVDAEPGQPINRTLVDTGILPGLLTPAQIALPPLADVEVISARAVAINEIERRVVLADGTALGADAIVIACGSAPRALDPAVQIAVDAAVHRLHGAADAEALRDALPDPAGKRVVVLGSGFIGAEVASHYAGAGAKVVLLGRSALPLRAAVGTRIAEHLAQLHRDHVDARFGSDIRAVRAVGEGQGVAVTLTNGELLEADALIVAQGTVPATDWAGRRDGIAVDSSLRVPGAPGVYAAGSAVVFELDGDAMRIDHWDDAAAQGAHVAQALLADLGEASDPGAYLPRSGFTLQLYGTVVAAKGVRAGGGTEHAADENLAEQPQVQAQAQSQAQVPRARLLTEFVSSEGRLAGVAGMNAGAGVAARARGIGEQRLAR